MKIIRLSYLDVNEDDGHLELAEIKDFLHGIIKGYRGKEIEDHLVECPICYDNYLTVKHGETEKNDQVESEKPMDRTHNKCLSEQDLERLRNGALNNRQLNDIWEHIEMCPRCEDKFLKNINYGA